MTDSEERESERTRLRNLRERIFDLMKDGQPRTLPEIQSVTGGLDTGVSAKLRDLRKPRYGGHKVERKRVKPGLWQYRLVLRARQMELGL